MLSRPGLQLEPCVHLCRCGRRWTARCIIPLPLSLQTTCRHATPDRYFAPPLIVSYYSVFMSNLKHVSRPRSSFQVVAFDASTRVPALDRTHYTGILSYEPRFKSDIPRLKGQPHTDPARPVIAITHPRNGSSVDAGASLHLEFILLNVMEGETLVRAVVNGESVIGMGVPTLNTRNFIAVVAPPPPSTWFDIQLSLVSSNCVAVFVL